MKKRLIAFGMMIVLVLCMSMTVFAAGVSADEQKVLDHFVSVQAKYASLMPAGSADKNIATATSVLNELEFSADACNDLNTVVSQLEAALAAKNPTTKKELQAMHDELVAIVNSTNSKYFTISATLDANTGVGTVNITLTPQPAPSGDNTPAAENTTATVVIGQGIINQTGVDTTATVAVIGGIAFISLLGVGAFVVSRSKKVAR